MAYESSGTLTTDKRTVDESETWSSQTDWEAYQSKTDIEISSGILQLASAIPDSGVSRWEFEQDVTDSWGNNDGTDNTSAGYTTNSAVGTYAKSFDGVDDYVATPYVFSSGTISVSAWVYMDDKTVNYIASTRSGNSEGFVLYYNDYDNQISWLMHDGTGAAVEARGPDIPTATWTHVVGTWNGSTMAIYTNGSSSGTASLSTHTYSPDGMDIGGDLGLYTTGDIDDPRIYDKALSSTEVSNLYNTGSISG